MHYSIESVLQVIITLSYDTLKYALLYLGVRISHLTNIKKQTIAVGIELSWGKYIIDEVAIGIIELMGVD